MSKVKIELNHPEDFSSSLSDILCWMNGFLEGKGENYNYNWLTNSLEDLRTINILIKDEIGRNEENGKEKK